MMWINSYKNINKCLNSYGMLLDLVTVIILQKFCKKDIIVPHYLLK